MERLKTEVTKRLKRVTNELRLVYQFFQRLPTDYYGSFVGIWSPPKPGEVFDPDHAFVPELDQAEQTPTAVAQTKATIVADNQTRRDHAKQGQLDTEVSCRGQQSKFGGLGWWKPTG